jgi:hypothetical protein
LKRVLALRGKHRLRLLPMRLSLARLQNILKQMRLLLGRKQTHLTPAQPPFLKDWEPSNG